MRETPTRLTVFSRQSHALALRLAVLVGGAMFCPSLLIAQRSTLKGVVRDSAGAGVPFADVSIVAEHILARADSAGAFTIANLRPGELELSVRRLGYEPTSLNFTARAGGTDTLFIVMRAQAELIPGMTISEQDMRRRIAIEDFYRRRARGQGNYVTREEIAARHATRLSDALAGVAGLSLVRRGVHGGMAVRFMNSSIIRRDCVPQYWLDGVRTDNVEIDDFPPTDIEGIELYQGPSTTPLQFSQGSVTKCGAIVIWTRVPGT